MSISKLAIKRLVIFILMDITLLFLLFPHAILLSGFLYFIIKEIQTDDDDRWSLDDSFKEELKSQVNRYNKSAFERDQARWKMYNSPSFKCVDTAELTLSVHQRDFRQMVRAWEVTNSPLRKLSLSPAFKTEFWLKHAVRECECTVKKYEVDASPLRQLAVTPEFQTELTERYYVLQDRFYQMDYFRTYVLPYVEPQSNIIMSSSFRKLLKDSIVIPKCAEQMRLQRKEEMDLAVDHLRPVLSELTGSYDRSWGVRLETLRHCLTQSIPIVELLPGHSTRIVVTSSAVLPALSNIEGIDYYTAKGDASKGGDASKCIDHVYISHCPAKTDRNTIINAVQSLKGIVMEADSPCKVSITALSNSEHITVLADTTPVTHQTTITLIRRSKALFNESLFNKCRTTVEMHLKNSSRQIRMSIASRGDGSSSGSWLTGVLQIKLEAEGITAAEFRKVTTDVIPVLNMIKDVIFASRTTEICWIK